jgi:hypothetical protein
MLFPAIATVLALSAAPVQDPAAGDQVLDNPSLDGGARGWLLRDGKARAGLGPRGETAVLLSGVEEEGKWSHLGVRLANAPALRELAFSVSVQGRPGHRALVNAFAYDEDEGVVAQWNERATIAGEDWQTMQATFVLPPTVAQFAIWIINMNPEDLLVAEPSLIVGARSVPRDLTSPGVIRATANTGVRARTDGAVGRVLFPIPLVTEHQVPLTFDVTVDPPEAFEGFRWVKRSDGANWLCEVSVAPSGDGTLVSWESLVLVNGRDDPSLPDANEPEAPKDTRPWLRSTSCIQSDDPSIVARSKALSEGADTIADYVQNVLRFTSTNRGNGAPLRSLDARVALDAGGSCTSRANLAAALLRARGIPARTSAHLPTWSGPLYEHWHVEYWHPGAGWTWIEPTLGKLRPKPWTLVVLNVANPDDEDQGFDPAIAQSGVMLGVPRFAVHEHSEELQLASQAWRAEHDQLNVAYAVAVLDGDPKRLFDKAYRAWESLAKRCRAGELDPTRTARIEAALDAESVTAALTKALAR